MKLGRGERDRPPPGDPIAGWCEHTVDGVVVRIDPEFPVDDELS